VTLNHQTPARAMPIRTDIAQRGNDTVERRWNLR
jgi:hypothetical protein